MPADPGGAPFPGGLRSDPCVPVLPAVPDPRPLFLGGPWHGQRHDVGAPPWPETLCVALPIQISFDDIATVIPYVIYTLRVAVEPVPWHTAGMVFTRKRGYVYVAADYDGPGRW